MSQPNQLVSKAIELQQNTLENSQQAMEQAVELPLQQSVALQRNAAELMLNGLEIGNWLGTQSVEFTRDALDSYIETVENAARDTSELTERGIQNAETFGQRGLRSTQRLATDFTGNGQVAATEGWSGQPQSYQPPAQPPQQGQSQRAPSQQMPPQQPQQRQAPPQQIPARQAHSQQTPTHQAPPQQTQPQRMPLQPQQMPPEQIQTQQSPPQEMPAQQSPIPQTRSQQVPTQQGPRTGDQMERPASRVPVPSATMQLPGGQEPVQQPSGRPTPDSQQPPHRAAVGESEQQAETPADNA